MARAMSAKALARVELNRSRIDEVYLGLADGMQLLAARIVAEADVPDAEPFGEGLVATGDSATWVNGKKIAGTASKPRGMRLEKTGITSVAGFGFPGRFLEIGTVDTRAQPFLTPSAARVLPDAPIQLSHSLRRRLGQGPT